MSGVINIPQAAAISTKCTKNAFQSRFPKLANGVSTKWDAMKQFLNSDSYATSLGVTGAAMYDLRMLITTGTERLNASPFVEMSAGGQADGMTFLLTQITPTLPFALTAAERTVIMSPPLLDSEIYNG